MSDTDARDEDVRESKVSLTTPRRMTRARRLKLGRPVDVVLRDLADIVHVEVCLNLAGLWDEMVMSLTRGECDRISQKLRQAARDFSDVAGALRTIRRRLPEGPPRERLSG